MNADATPPIAVLDRPEVLLHLFHPRPEPPGIYHGTAHDLMIPVAPEVAVGARFHMQAADNPNLTEQEVSTKQASVVTRSIERL